MDRNSSTMKMAQLRAVRLGKSAWRRGVRCWEARRLRRAAVKLRKAAVKTLSHEKTSVSSPPFITYDMRIRLVSSPES